MALFNCLLYTWYGLPVVSYKWENFPVLLVSCSVALISAYALHDHQHRKAFVGSVGLVASVAMYGSPLIVMKKVIQTKSVEFMPFYLSLFSFLASSLWMAYGLLSHDLFLASPNLVGSPLGILQLFLYCIYRKKVLAEPPHKWDLESHSEKLDQHLEVNEGKTEKPIQYLKVNDEKDDEKANQQLQLVVTDATHVKS